MDNSGSAAHGEWDALYRSLRTDAASAVAHVASGAKIAIGLAISQPPAILEALADRARAGDVGDISVYYLLSSAIGGRTILRSDLRTAIRPVSLFHSPIERQLDREAPELGLPQVDFIPTAFSRSPTMLSDEVGVDTLLTTVSPMDADGFFSLGTNVDYALGVSKTARTIILEVNRHMPRVAGDCRIHVSQVTALVENNVPLLEIPDAVLRPADERIGAIIAGMIPDGACLQMGIGAVPQAVCAALGGHRHLGIHTELLTPGLTSLMQKGIADNSRKTIHPGKTLFTFAMGDRSFYDYMNESADIEGHPVDYVNDPGVIAANERMISVNATLEIDLQGACNSEYMGGQYSAAGGQLDFVRGASASKGGMSIIACHSTAAGGTVSRIVPKLSGPVTTPRNDIQFVVTEYGMVNLRGLTLQERATALIGIADPAFREQLSRAAFETWGLRG